MRRALATAIATCLVFAGNTTFVAAQTPAAIAPATELEEITAPLMRFQTAFNTSAWQFPGDVFADDAVAVDGFAPFVWQGQGGIRTWYAALLGSNAAENEAFRAQNFNLVIGKPLIVRRDGDRAYAVFPATNSWTKDGKRLFERAHWAITFVRGAQGWRISGNAWNIVAEGTVERRAAKRLRHKRL